MGAEGGIAASLDDLLEGGSLSKLLREGNVGDYLAKLIEQAGQVVLEPRADGSSLLHRFALLGCYDAVKMLWENGAKPSILKSDGSTLLHSAVRTTDCSQDEQRSRIIALFLNGGTSRQPIGINHRNAKGWTTLKLAARKELEQCVEVLLNHSADPNIADYENYLPIHNAIGNHAIVKLLVSHANTNVNTQTKDGESLLYLAVDRGIADCALTLLEHGADPNVTNKEGISPLFLAARGGKIELVRVLLRKGAHVNITGAAQQIAPLHWAAHKEYTDIALLLIEFGADIFLKDQEGRTPLSMASPELATKMLELAKQRNPQLSFSPLTVEPTVTATEKAIAACCGGNVQALQSLLNAGVSVNHVNEGTTSTLLHMAVYCGQVGVIALLLSNGANWQIRDKDGDTVLHFACMKEVAQGNHDAALEFLLSTPAATLINVQNSRGDTPLLVTLRCQFFSRAKILMRHKADTKIKNNKNELALHRACCTDNNIGIVLQLTELLPDLNIKDNDGWTPLMYAARSKSSAIVHYLLQRGVDPNLQQSVGFTALHLAAQENLPDVCKLLLSYHADPNITAGAQQITPLHIAAHKSFKDVCTVLVEHGANYALEDKDGDTPLTLTKDEDLKQAILSAYDNYCVEVHQCNNTDHSPTNVPRFSTHPLCLLRKFSSKEFEDDSEKIVQLQHEIMEKENCMTKIICELKNLRSENELLESRLRACEEDLKQRNLCSEMDDLSVEEEDGTLKSKPWWLVGVHELTISDHCVNDTSECFQRFFDVHLGAYREMNIAIKKVRQKTTWDCSVRKTFLREVEQLSHLHCPNVVQFIGACADKASGLYCLLMEYMPCGDLHTLLHINKVKLEQLEKMAIVRDIATGMCFLHTFPILHRNLTPRNILIGEKLNAKISDFGLYETKVQTNFYADLRKSCTRESKKRPIYKAPEVIEKNAYSMASDVYTFGLIMYEMAAEKKAFSDMDPCQTPMIWIMKLFMGARPTLPPTLAPECQAMICQCWNADPMKRPTFKEFLVHCYNTIEKTKASAAAEISNEDIK